MKRFYLALAVLILVVGGGLVCRNICVNRTPLALDRYIDISRSYLIDSGENLEDLKNIAVTVQGEDVFVSFGESGTSTRGFIVKLNIEGTVHDSGIGY